MKKLVAGFLGAAVILIYFGQACSQDTGGQTDSSSSVSSQSSNLMASPQTILVDSQTSIQPNGGTAPYNYSIVSGSGSLSGNIFTAPSLSGVTFVKITDATGASVIDTISISISGSGISPTPTPVPTPPPSSAILPTFQSATYTSLQSYQSSCSSANPMADSCVSAIHRYCVATGFVTGFGPLELTNDSMSFTCLPATAAASITTSFTILQTFVPGCTGSNTHSDLCSSAVHRFCASQGFVSGFGPVEYGNGMALVSCVNSSKAAAGGQNFSALTSYNAGCNSSAPVSPSCNSAIHNYCAALGYTAGGFGAVEHSGEYLSLVCVRTN